jgi:hypothetical protein
MNAKHWSIATAIEQIDKCDFECEAGPLSLNQGYIWLKAAAKVGPQFWPGQGVWYKITGEISGFQMERWAHLYIVGCAMSSDTEQRLWTYSLSSDPPAPWHYGTVAFTGVTETALSLVDPAKEDA